MISSRQKAQELIKEGKVLVNKKVVSKNSLPIVESDLVEIVETLQYVGRGAHKLQAAIELFKLNFYQKIIGDFGASTGGFTQISLKAGASKVYAIDVGHGQLDQLLLEQSKVINLEGINIKNGVILPELLDFAVCDLSFISLRLVLQPILNCLKENGAAIILFKPQFEVGRKYLGKKGVVEYNKGKEALEDFYAYCAMRNLSWSSWMDSPILGKQGNREYLICLDLSLKEMPANFDCLNQGENL